jgi:hypothetical protein
MKTHEELVEEFRQEFEKKRRKSIHNLWWEIPFIIGLFVVMIFMLLGLSQVYLINTGFPLPIGPNDLRPIGLEEKIFIAFVELFLLGVMITMAYVYPSRFLEEYRISHPDKYTSEQLQRSIKRIPILERRISMLQTKIENQKFLLERIQDPQFEIINSNPLYSDNVSPSLKKNEELLKQHLESMDYWRDFGNQLRAKLEVYAQIPEKNLWQYLKSGKWYKKQYIN